MRKILFLSFILLVQLTLSAQDKIITTSGDTIFCRIVSVSDNHLVYEQQADKKHASGKTISFGDVAEYSRVSTVPPSKEISSSRTPEQPWLLSLHVGGAHLPWLLESMGGEYAENDDYKKYAKGFALNANAYYLVTQHVGFGIQYSFFTSGHKGIYPTRMGQSYVYSNSDIRERQYINYAGISAIFRQFLDKGKKFSLSETLGGGLLLYRSESQSKIFIPNDHYFFVNSQYYNYNLFTYISQNALTTGDTFGATFGISAEYKILPCLSAGIGGSFMYGSLSKISGKYENSMGSQNRTTGHKLKTPFKLSRIDYSLVLRFNL